MPRIHYIDRLKKEISNPVIGNSFRDGEVSNVTLHDYLRSVKWADNKGALGRITGDKKITNGDGLYSALRGIVSLLETFEPNRRSEKKFFTKHMQHLYNMEIAITAAAEVKGHLYTDPLLDLIFDGEVAERAEDPFLVSDRKTMFY